MNDLSIITTLLPRKEEIDKVLDREASDLPAVPIVLAKLLKITSDETSAPRDLAILVETDPAITAKVLKIVNSASYGLNQKVSSVKQAIMIMGFSALRSLALEVTLFEQLVQSGHSSYFDRILFWRHCLCVACLSRALAGKAGHPDPEEAYVAGLLHDIGKIVMDVYGRISYSDFLNNLPYSNGLLIEEEHHVLGMGHDDVGAYFCRHWDMSDSIVLAIKLHHRPFAHLGLSSVLALTTAIVALADFIAWTQGIGSIKALRHPILQPEVFSLIDSDRIDMEDLIFRMDEEIKTIAEFYHFAFPTPEQLRKNLLLANINLGRSNAESFRIQAQLKQKLESLSHTKTSLASPHQSLDSKEIVLMTLKAIRQDFSYDRLYVLRIDERSRSLKATGILDTTGTPATESEFTIHVTPFLKGFTECLRAKTPVVITGNTHEEREVLKALKVRQMGLVPVTHNDSLVGIIGVDNILSGRAIEPEDLSNVAIVASELGTALEHARIVKEYKFRASMDPLTHVFNRGAIESFLKESFLLTMETGKPLSIGMLDIDFFKKFNDSFGHLAGDSVLKLVAAALNKFSRPSDHVGRYGGEEFLFVMNDTVFDHALVFGERLRKKIEKLGRILQRRFKGHALTVSIGIASFEPQMARKEDLIAKADAALYGAKESGRNRTVGFTGKIQKTPPW